MAHQTFLILHRACVPFLKVGLAAFAPAHGRKVEKDGGEGPFGCSVLPRELAQQKELLGSGVLDCRESARAEVHPEFQCLPTQQSLHQ
jgi:hypothetical protein